jgi:hypothetical protein
MSGKQKPLEAILGQTEIRGNFSALPNPVVPPDLLELSTGLLIWPLSFMDWSNHTMLYGLLLLSQSRPRPFTTMHCRVVGMQFSKPSGVVSECIMRSRDFAVVQTPCPSFLSPATVRPYVIAKSLPS